MLFWIGHILHFSGSSKGYTDFRPWWMEAFNIVKFIYRRFLMEEVFNICIEFHGGMSRERPSDSTSFKFSLALRTFAFTNFLHLHYEGPTF